MTAVTPCVVECGWGRLLFGQTFQDPKELAEVLSAETEGRRDIALYVRDPHVVLSVAPQDLFLDPSHTFRLWLDAEQGGVARPHLTIRQAEPADEEAVRRIYLARGMIAPPEGFLTGGHNPDLVPVLVAADDDEGQVAGVVMGVDHVEAFLDPERGSSLWALAVDPQSPIAGVGRALTLALAAHFRERGRAYMDLSVMHNNSEAIELYGKLGFARVPVYCVKRKNPINESLYVGPDPVEGLNVYARIIVDEARRRGIGVEVLDAENGFFRLVLGGRVITCRESLTELTSAIALQRCDDKAITRKVLTEAGLRMPEQIEVSGREAAAAFLRAHKRVVVKPARGEQGMGVAVDLTDLDEVMEAVEAAEAVNERVLMEAFAEGQDLRVIVIDGAVAAAAVRRPPEVLGDGRRTVRELIERQSRRRSAATGGESTIPLDGETERCVKSLGVLMDEVISPGARLAVRKTANLHTGGTIHDVTGELHPEIAEAAIAGARALEIPVVGFDFLVPDPAGPDYVIIEANERPGLANHEPQPTAERFVDFLFPQTRAGERVGVAP